MKMKNLKILFCAVMIILAYANVDAQYTGPGATLQLYTVQEVKKEASRMDKADVMVNLQGHIIRQLNAETYRFKDQTGEVNVEIEFDVLPDTPFDEHKEVILTGEVDYDELEGVEIEVERLEFTNP